MLCRLMSLLVYKYGLYPAFEKAGISPDFVLKIGIKPRTGFEPATSSLPRTRYTELSYRGAQSPLCSPFKNLSVKTR